MKQSRVYTYKANAIRAARAHCKRILGPNYDAKEGLDFVIRNHSILDPEFSYALCVRAMEVEEGRVTKQAKDQR